MGEKKASKFTFFSWGRASTLHKRVSSQSVIMASIVSSSDGCGAVRCPPAPAPTAPGEPAPTPTNCGPGAPAPTPAAQANPAAPPAPTLGVPALAGNAGAVMTAPAPALLGDGAPPLPAPEALKKASKAPARPVPPPAPPDVDERVKELRGVWTGGRESSGICPGVPAMVYARVRRGGSSTLCSPDGDPGTEGNP